MTTTTQHAIQTDGRIIGQPGMWQLATLTTPDGMAEYGRPYGSRDWQRLTLSCSQRNAVRHACGGANSQEFDGVLTSPRTPLLDGMGAE